MFYPVSFNEQPALVSVQDITGVQKGTGQSKAQDSVYSQEQLFYQVVLPLYQSYPEIAWFADPEVAATQEGTGGNFGPSWTAALVREGLLPKTDKKYVELERMLHSLVCFRLLLEGSPAAYRYWVQSQERDSLSWKSFQALHRLAQEQTKTREARKSIEASLVYSDLGKTPEAKRRAGYFGLIQKDHDEFMEAVYSAPIEVRNNILPSFEHLSPRVQERVLALHSQVPLHWGHVVHLEGGAGMFSRLVAEHSQHSSQVHRVDFVKQAYLIQVCDVAAAQAHRSLRGSITFNEFTYLQYQGVLKTVEKLLKTKDAKIAFLDLAYSKLDIFGYSKKAIEQKEGVFQKLFILSRIGSFLRLHNKQEGALLKNTAEAHWSPEDWTIVEEMFGFESGINLWKRNPTYMPAVVLNLFNSTLKVSEKYERALTGAFILAQIAKEYQIRGFQDSNTPLCFNSMAAQAQKYPQWFSKSWSISQLDWSHPDSVVLNVSTVHEGLLSQRKSIAWMGFIVGVLPWLWVLRKRKKKKT